MQRAEEQAGEAGQGLAVEHVLLVLSKISNSYSYYVLSIPQAYFPKRSLSNNDTTFALAIGDSPPPIVSAEELVGAKNLRPNHPGSGIIQISPSTVVKFGHQVCMSEAETMHLLARKVPGVPIPKLKNAYTIAGVGYIVMEYIRGKRLGECWKTMGKVEKSAVVTQLQQYVSSWRRITGFHFGTVNDGPCKERLFNHPYYPDIEESYGPFKTRKEYNCGLVNALRSSRPHHVTIAPSLESRIMRSSGDEMILTHGDLYMNNIIIGDDGQIAAILDWGESCYSLEEMEYCCTRWGTHNDEWRSYLPYFVPEFPARFLFWDNLNNEMRVYSGI